jgi:CxxC motif-containing protein (DUF1111 family)
VTGEKRFNASERRRIVLRRNQHNRRVGSLWAFATISVFSLEGVAAPNNFGDPLPGLTAEQLALFEEGKEEFEEVETAADGLGPTFNGRGCAECHSQPVVGGASAQNNEVRAGQVGKEGFIALPGGSIFQIDSIPPTSVCGEVVPPEANVIALRQTQPLFGMGLIEAIPDASILVRADPADQNGDGVSGRAAWVFDPATNSTRLGRFGWKAQVATLLTFSGDAYLNEMGITNDLFPEEEAPNGEVARLQSCDGVPDPEDETDPETGRRGIDDFENYMRFLGPPPRANITLPVIAGELIFVAIGCAGCHTPVMLTGPNAIPALDRKPVVLYSDLLLHDVGDTDGDGFPGDGIPQADAAANELRTAPLWGLRASAPFLHDGSAPTIRDAILRHGGEASQATARFRSLPPIARDLLLTFLESL